jgi:hypothetical protein
VDLESTDIAEVATTSRRRPWLGIVCAVALVALTVGWWWHVEDPFNPYRDGTTHSATLVHIQPECQNAWQITLDDGGYTWQPLGPVPAALGPGPIEGRVHIIQQRSTSMGQSSATFEAGGLDIPLYGGRQPVFFDAVCSIR